jgi:gliding motility-associated-like protein
MRKLSKYIIFIFFVISASAGRGLACPVIDSVVITPATCKYTSDAAVIIYASGSGTFEYSIDGGQNFTASNVFTAVSTGNYWVVVRANACSNAVQQITVSDNSFLSASFQFSQDSGNVPLTTTFFNTSFGSINLIWDFGDGSPQITAQDTVTHIYTSSGNYNAMLIVSNANCSDTLIQLITVIGESSLVIPNVFSPNGDEINDFFRPISFGMKTLEGKIFNRYGNLIYEWKGTGGGWDGYNYPIGVEATEGTYYYVIEAEGIDGKIYSEHGILTLIR